MLRDVQTFVAALDTLFGSFRQRADKTFALLQAEGTAFVVVAAPEPDALREAAYFVDRLTDDDMPLAGLVVNRATPAARTELSAEEAITAADRLRSGDSSSLAAGLLRLHADRVRIVEREQHLRERFVASHPQVPTAVVPAMAADVHDLGRPARHRRGDGGAGLRSDSRPREPRPWSARSPGWSATTSRDDGGAAHGAHARSCRPRHPTRSGCPVPRPGTRCVRGNPHTPAWPCSAPRRARRVRPACPPCKRRAMPSPQPT